MTEDSFSAEGQTEFGTLKASTRLEPLGAEALRSGLAAFITPSTTAEVEHIPLEQLKLVHPSFRLTSLETGLEQLSESMRRHGFIGALVGRKRGKLVELAFGERRTRAASQAGLKTIPVQVRDLDDAAMFELALHESFLGSKLTALEEALVFKKMLADGRYTIATVAERCSRSVNHVNEALLLIQYPEIEQALRQGQIETETARALAKIEDAPMRAKLLNTALALGTGESIPARFMVASAGYEQPAVLEFEEESTDETEPPPQLWGANGKPKKSGRKSLEAQYKALEELVSGFVGELKKQELAPLGEDEEWRKKSRRLLKSVEAALELSVKQLKA